jgi:hypothetical protein
MAITAGKVVPSLIVTSFVGYCIWPTVSQMSSGPRTPPHAEKVSEIANTLFSPALPPRPTKNPFGGLNADELAEAKAAGRFGTQTKKATTVTKDAAKPNFNPLVELRLEATSILGNEKLAIINGKFYGPGQSIAFDGAATGCIVADILPTKVLLKFQGKILTLAYSNSPLVKKPRPAAPSDETQSAK